MATTSRVRVASNLVTPTRLDQTQLGSVVVGARSEVRVDVNELLRVALYRFRVTFRRQWPHYLSLVVLIGVMGGVAMGAVAGARRTQSAYPVYVASTNPRDVAVFIGFDNPGLGLSSGYSSKTERAIDRLPVAKHVVDEITRFRPFRVESRPARQRQCC